MEHGRQTYVRVDRTAPFRYAKTNGKLVRMNYSSAFSNRRSPLLCKFGKALVKNST